MKKLILICLIFTLRLLDGTVTTYGSSWGCRIVNFKDEGSVVMMERMSGNYLRQAFEINEIDYLSNGKDVIVKNGRFVAKHPEDYMWDGE